MEKIYYANTNQKEVGVAILITEKTNLTSKTSARYKIR